MKSDRSNYYEKTCQQNHFKLTDKSKQALFNKLTNLHANRENKFGNRRLVRNIFEKTIDKQVNRLVKFSDVTKEMMIKIMPEDIP
ncbi:MAG: hypothetical protein V7K40_25035 [Nostoc sp.]|uniref:hypothetical protein n=1 Tax=Nostoc sp. TaxID=1180 RepID=UPI002FF5E0A6